MKNIFAHKHPLADVVPNTNYIHYKSVIKIHVDHVSHKIR